MIKAVHHLLIALASSLVVTAALAMPAVARTGVTLAPAYRDISLINGQDATYIVSLTNTSDQSLAVQVSSRNFSALGTGGGIDFAKPGEKLIYGLAHAIEVAPQSFTLGPRSTEQAVVTIRNSSDLKHGGHYAAVLFSIKNSENVTTGIVVEQSLASLVFATKGSPLAPKLQTQKVTILQDWFQMPKEIDVVVANQGNVHATPEGSVTIYDPFGDKVSKDDLNPDRGRIIPETIRRFVLGTKSAAGFWPGMYRAEVMVSGTKHSQLFFAAPITGVITLVIAGAILTIVYRRMLAPRLRWLLTK